MHLTYSTVLYGKYEPDIGRYEREEKGMLGGSADKTFQEERMWDVSGVVEKIVK